MTSELPTGTVTFLFTDLEGSTRLWEEHPDAMRDALARHDEILRDAVGKRGGYVVKTTGDGLHAAFATAHDAVDSCIDAQQQLGIEPWPAATGPLKVRMGVHTGEADIRDGDYFGQALNRAARLMAVGHGGQVLASESVETITRGSLPDGVTLRDLGEHRLRDLSDAIRVFQVVHPALPADFPPPRSLDALPGNLPRQVTTFVGREAEIDALTALLRERSLVTLTGVGGVGKTRLALQVAAEAVPDFPDGAWFCELAPVTDPGALWDVLAATLGVPPAPGRPVDDAVLDYLAPKRLLLLLDNCEHLLDATARMARAVAQRGPNVTVLATSREGLALAGEQLVAVPSLGVPDDADDRTKLADAEAVVLFVDRALAAKRDFALDSHNASSVAQLCRRLDGIPLAIELAAARVRSLTPRDLVDRLDQRFKLLTRGSRAALERHQTLRSTIDWSYDLLEPAERTALNRLSVFVGGCDLAGAEAVLGGDDLDQLDVADALGQLVDKSLVVVDEDSHGARYRLLETIRQYAQERLEASGDAASVRRRHAERYVEVAEQAAPHLRGSDQIASAAEVARETDNFRAALDWAAETASPDLALRMVAPLGVFGTSIGYAAMEWADTASAIPEAEQHALFPSVAAWAAWGAAMHGDWECAELLIARAEASERALGVRVPAVCQPPATLAMFRGDLETALRYSDEWVRLARPGGDPYELASALIMQSSALQVSDAEGALRTLEEAVQVAREGGVASALSIGLSNLGGSLPDTDSERALELLAEAEEIGSQVGDTQGVAHAITMRGWIACRRGEWRDALDAAARTAQQRLRNGDLAMIFDTYLQGAAALAGLGFREPAALLHGAGAGAVFEHPGPDWWLEMEARTRGALLDGLGAERLAVLLSTGAAMSDPEAVAYLRAEADRVLREE